jgi:hypothetical protein
MESIGPPKGHLSDLGHRSSSCLGVNLDSASVLSDLAA